MKTKTIKYFTALLMISLLSACGDFLDIKPQGAVESSQLVTPTNADALLVAAYACLKDGTYGATQADTWFSAIRSGDNYKGGAGTADFGNNYPLEMFNIITADTPRPAGAWTSNYSAISRANKALTILNQLTDAEMPLRQTRIAEARMLRAHWNFQLKRLFKYFVYVDETTTNADAKTKSNREFTNDQLWDKIADDLEFAYNNLPATQPQVGRATKFAAAAYLVKVRLYQAYEQDESYNVININQARLNEVVAWADIVINSAKYNLFDNYGKMYTYGYDNGIESIWAIQFSVNDGAGVGQIDQYHMGDYNMAPGYGCCWANVPTQNMVNAFKTDPATGLPLYDTYNDSDMDQPAEFLSNTVDPRLDHTVGIPTHPFKYALNFVYDYSWARTPSVYGNYSSMKFQQLPTSPSFKSVGGFYSSSKNIEICRYDDVLLMKAEALIELNRENEALPLINQIRTRAANTDWLKYSNGTTFSNYRIDNYQDGVNCTWTKAFARQALQWERRLEFGTESSRFYDLVRWGIAAETINAYFAVEKTKRAYLNAASFRKNQDEYFPIPNAQITLSEGLYQQNTGAW